MEYKIFIEKILQIFKLWQSTGNMSNYTYFFYKQPVYKQLALGWQIAKQLSGIHPLSLTNNKNCRLKKSGVFPF